MTEERTSNKPDLIAYAVEGKGEKSYYHRIGAGWTNSKGGAKVILNAFPVNGELLLLPPRSEERDD